MQPVDRATSVTSVSELTHRIRNLLEANLSNIWVEGEVSNFIHHSSGHMYFSLKDPDAQIRCAMFRNANRSLTFKPANGTQVRAFGSVSVYPPQGSYQLIVHQMIPAGLGDRHIAFEKLKAKLQKEGLFDAKWKKAIPAFPRRIGVVTAPGGAAIHDIIHVIGRRFPLVDLVLCPAAVQGATAASEIVRAIRTFRSLPADQRPDVLIVGRGGGSIEDLWPFNEEIVARAVFDCEIPVISAVGHEVDFTMCDFVADYRAPTPSAAAEKAVPDASDIRKNLSTMKGRFQRNVSSLLENLRLKISQIRHRPLFNPEQLIRHYQLTLDRLQDQLAASARDRLHVTAARLAQIQSVLAHQRPDRRLNQYRFDLARFNDTILAEWQRSHQKRVKETDRLAGCITSFSLDRFRHRIELIEARLEGHNPKSILEKGYAICTRPDGSIVSSVSALHVSDHLEVELRDGILECEVNQIREE